MMLSFPGATITFAHETISIMNMFHCESIIKLTMPLQWLNSGLRYFAHAIHLCSINQHWIYGS